MAVTIKPVLKAEPKADGTHLILLRVTVARTSKYVGLGYYIRKKDFNPKATLDKENWVRSSHHLHEVYNTAIAQKIHATMKAVVEAEKKQTAITADLVQQVVKGKTDKSFLSFFHQTIQKYNTEEKHRLFEKYTNVYNKLADYLRYKKKKDLSFTDLNLKFIREFETWLMTDYRAKQKDGTIRTTAKPNNRNTTSKTLSFIKTIVRQAVLNNEMAYAENPFLNLKLDTEKTHKDRLTRPEIQAFIQMPINPELQAHHVRNIFLMQYYCAGSRIGDMLKLKWENIQGERLVFLMEKTGERQSLKLTKQALAILSEYSGKPTDYIFPFLQNHLNLSGRALDKKADSARSMINERLKELFQKLGVNKKVTTHVARHSFADQARRNGVSINDISMSLRHSSPSITQVYLESFDSEAVDNVLDNLFGEEEK